MQIKLCVLPNCSDGQDYRYSTGMCRLCNVATVWRIHQDMYGSRMSPTEVKQYLADELELEVPRNRQMAVALQFLMDHYEKLLADDRGDNL